MFEIGCPARDRSVIHAVALTAALVLVAACNGSTTGIEGAEAYMVTEGACGSVVFAETIGIDSASAFDVIKSRKTEQFGAGEVTLEAYELGVVDDRGRVPEPDFYAIRVEDAETGMLVHSVVEVITTEGNLFNLLWCPD